MEAYWDNNATTPVDPRVAAEVMRLTETELGNAGSRTHHYGLDAARVVGRARDRVAAVMGARPDEIVFTSGATEANNLAILGLVRHGRASGRTHVLSTAIEHKAVLEPLERLSNDGFDVELVPPGADGAVDATDLLGRVRPDTLLVSVMHANNETGVLQPVTEIADGLRESEAYLHVDAAQTFGKELDALVHPRLDLVAVSAHKIFGPKGVGALLTRRRGYTRPPLTPLMVGGGQERGLRPGTLPVALLGGFGLAAELAVAEHAPRRAACLETRDQVVDGLAPLRPSYNGDPDKTLAHTLNVSFPRADGEAVMVAWRDLVAVSNGSACTSSRYEPSHVLLAMRLSDERVRGAVRLSWSHLAEPVDWSSAVERVHGLTNSPA